MGVRKNITYILYGLRSSLYNTEPYMMIPLAVSLDCEELILYSTQKMHEEEKKQEGDTRTSFSSLLFVNCSNFGRVLPSVCKAS